MEIFKETPMPSHDELKTISDRGCCAIVAVVTLSMCYLLSQGMQATDDLFYAIKASQVLKSGFALADISHQTGRIGAYLPLAFIFQLFGVSDFTLSLLPVTPGVRIDVASLPKFCVNLGASERGSI